ncbi:MAG: oxidoreductase [Candidatus Bathyarchaeota archaeon]
MVKYSKLFEPIKIGKVLVSNRIVMAAMGVGYAGLSGEVTEQLIAHFEAAARGGVGLIVVEATYIHPAGRLYDGETSIEDDKFIIGLARLAQRVKSYGVRVALQINHGGVQSKVSQPVGPTAIGRMFSFGGPPRELSRGEIEEVIDAYAAAAQRVMMAGFDMVEVHGTHGYLVAQFLSPITNKRSDEYGADRTLFAVNIVKRIREKCGKGYPIIFRLSATEFVEGGITVEFAKNVAKKLEEAGVDAIGVTGGNYDTAEHIIQPIYIGKQGYFFDYASQIKENVTVPIISGGCIFDPDIAEKAVKDGVVDMVFLGRQLLADPSWPKKVRENRVKEIRPCILCNECINRILNTKPLICSVNPLKGYEFKYVDEGEIVKTSKPKLILVVGGGPAGLEVARVTKIKGHKVLLYDEKRRIGGTALLASKPEFKWRIEKLVEYYENVLKKLGVKFKLGEKINLKNIKKINPDVVIFATGSKPLKPNLPGVNYSVMVDDVLLGKVKVGRKVIVVGGGLVGCETALYLSMKGKNVTIVEVLPQIAAGEPLINSITLYRELVKHGVNVLVNHRLLEIYRGGVVVADENGKKRSIEADTVVLAVGREPNIDGKLVSEARKTVKEVYIIGDAKEARKILYAVHEGFYTALQI